MYDNELLIKNMVCNRCIRVVSEDIEKLGFKIETVELGRVVLESSINENELNSIKNVLENSGFELLSTKANRIISLIKIEIIRVIHHQENIPLNIKFSQYLSQQIGRDYSYLSNLFSVTEGITIEKYLILQKIERAKELLVYDELSLSEIAFQLGYNSAQYLSSQFKNVTGQTTSNFKNNHKNERLSLDNVINQNKM